MTRPVPQEVTRSRDLPWLTADYGLGRGYWLGVEEASGGVIGWFGLRPLAQQPDIVMLGYRLRPSA